MKSFFEMEAQLENNSIIQEASRINSIGLIQYYFEQSIQEIDNTIRYCNEFQLYDETTNYFSEALLSQNTKDKLKELARKIFGPLIKLLSYLYNKIKRLFDKDKQVEQEIKKSKIIRLNIIKFFKEKYKQFNPSITQLLEQPIILPEIYSHNMSRKDAAELIPMFDYEYLYNKVVSPFTGTDDRTRDFIIELYQDTIGLDTKFNKYNVTDKNVRHLVRRVYYGYTDSRFDQITPTKVVKYGDLISNGKYSAAESDNGLGEIVIELKKFMLNTVSNLKNYAEKLQKQSENPKLKADTDSNRPTIEKEHIYLCKYLADYIKTVISALDQCTLTEYKVCMQAWNQIYKLDKKLHRLLQRGNNQEEFDDKQNSRQTQEPDLFDTEFFDFGTVQ